MKTTEKCSVCKKKAAKVRNIETGDLLCEGCRKKEVEAAQKAKMTPATYEDVNKQASEQPAEATTNQTEQKPTEPEKLETCSACGAQHAARFMMTEPKKPGSEHETTILCPDCVDKLTDEQVQSGGKGPGLHTLEASRERDRRYDEFQAKADETRKYVLAQKWVPQELKKADETLVCCKCGKSHGSVRYDKRARKMRVTVIVNALPLDFEQDPVTVDPICNDCRAEILSYASDEQKQKGKMFHSLLTSRRLAEEANEFKKEQQANLDEIRRRQEQKMYFPKGGRGNYDSGRHGQNRKTGTHGR